MKKYTLSTFILFTVLISCNTPAKKDELQQTFEPDALADTAMVVSAHPAASAVGVEILKKGGNTFDAAVAVQFALAVVYPQAGNIGGGGFAVFRKDDGELGTLDYREMAPITAFKDMYLDSSGNVIDGLSTKGHLAAGVPGVVDGMVRLHEKYGVLPWADLVNPAVDLAEHGFAIKEEQAERINRHRQDFIDVNDYEIPFLKEEPWKKGDTIKLPVLAKTLKEIANNGRAGFYSGSVAESIIKEMQRGNGAISQDDLDKYEAKWRTPLTGNYKGYKIITMPPPSSGGVAILQMLQGAEQLHVGATEPNSAERTHLLTELMRRVYADRATYLGDPDFYNVPLDMLLDQRYNSLRFSTIQKDKATPSSEIKEGNVEIIESTETTHFTIVDKDRNAIAITTTLNGLYGCKVMVEGAGFFLNNEMDDFSAKPGVANQFGLVGAEANAIAPGKRMLSSMTPTIVEIDGELFLTTGTRGGSTIITSVFQTILNTVEDSLDLKQAIEMPRMHHQWQPDVVYLEGLRYDSAQANSLKKMGYEVDAIPVLGKMRAIEVLEDGTLEGASDPIRSQGSAQGY